MLPTILWLCLLASSPTATEPNGIDRLVSHIQEGRHGEVHSLLISQNGRLIKEAYFKRNPRLPKSIGTPSGLHMVQSSTKSIHALLVLIAIEQGLFSLDTTLAELFSDYYTIHDDLKTIPIRHLLSMRDGIAWHQWANLPREQLDHVVQQQQPDYVAYALNKPAAHPPGEVFNYSSAAPILTAAAIRLRADQSVKEFARINLFEPLDIKNVNWLIKDQTGLIHTGAGLAMTSKDFLKIGELVLNKGVYAGKRLIDETLLDAATQTYSENVFKKPNQRTQGMGYGWFWWLRPLDGENLILAMGRGEQSLLVSRKHRMVLVTTGWNDEKKHRAQIIGFFSDYVLPSGATP